MAFKLKGDRHEIARGDTAYPKALDVLEDAPERLYVLGSVDALSEGLAVVGARKATPYGLSCAHRFATLAAKRGICIVSGGAKGCDSQSHMAALEQGSPTVVFFGSGINNVYPYENRSMFQTIVDSGGAIVSEYSWEVEPRPFMFRMRNRLIAGLAKATLIVEAGLPSGTFTTADYAIDANREVWVVPGAITSKHSHGANTLIYQGAVPIIDDETFEDHLNSLFEKDGGDDNLVSIPEAVEDAPEECKALLEAVRAEPLSLDEMCAIIAPIVGESQALREAMLWVSSPSQRPWLARYPDGRYGPALKRE